MCKICIDVAKEALTPSEFWNNFREMKDTDDHWMDVLAEVMKTSSEYQTALSNESLRES